MDDLFGKLQEILSSEEGQAQLKGVAQMLGMGGDTPAKNPPPPTEPVQSPEPQPPPPAIGDLDLSGIAQMLSSFAPQQTNSTSQPPPENNNAPDSPGIDINMIMKIQQMVKSMNTDDDTTRLLLALKPHFSEDRRAKVDKAIQLLRLYALLPMIKETGILGGLFGNGGK